ncbi:MAG TPA: glycoside hydrolase domain-containing protein [Phycisphaerae bacterium]|nr:glycoside hydrolase domain-containing protein [Phycisphaerae bacterium]
MFTDVQSGWQRAGRVLCIGALWIAGWVCPGGAGAAPTAVPDQAVTILDAKNTFFRWTCLSRPAVMVAEPGSTERTSLAGGKLDAGRAGTVSGEMPAQWGAAEFDDSAWPRTTAGRLAYVAFRGDGKSASRGETLWNAGVLCLRGKFRADPAGVEQLYLTARYRGGVVVYLNGQEVARGGLPAGELTPATPGEPYPPEAYLDPAGKPLPDPSRVKTADKDLLDRIASRDRTLGPVELPAKALRQGVNVLAVEIHRSDYPAAAAKFLSGSPGWVPCGLVDLRLATVGGGAAPNCARPAGVQVWTQDRHDRSSVWDYGDPNEKLQPITLTGARNGVFSGKVVVSSDQALGKVTAQAGELKRVGGDGIIPAAALRVQYAEPTMDFNWMTKWVEPVSPGAPEKVERPKTRTPGAGAMVEVLLTVAVPADAAPGDYAGTLAVSVDGTKAADVPVRLHVADWTLPAPRDFRTFVGIYQSPTAIALTYQVPEWSERHWQLMEPSMALLGQLGNQLVQIPVVDQTRLGNDDGMVTWVRDAEGRFDYDYSVVERYLKLVRKYMGPPKFVVLHVFHPGGWTPAGPKQENTVTVLDSKTGQREHLQVPQFGTEEAKTFWTPVLLGLKERLAKEGMEKSLVLGSLTEGNPTAAEFKTFSDILGTDVQWLRITHRQQGNLDRPVPALSGGGRTMPHIYTYLPGLPSADGPVVPVHKGYWPRLAYYRRAQGVRYSLIGHRQIPMHTLFLQLPGFSHLCLDFWPVKEGRRDRGGLLWGRWPRANGYPGDPEPAYLTWPGPDGAEPMTAYEALREGLQEAEALVVISQALAENEAGLGPELADRCRQALRDELTFCLSRSPFIYQYVHLQMNHHGWQELSGRLFALAGEVAARTGK